MRELLWKFGTDVRLVACSQRNGFDGNSVQASERSLVEGGGEGRGEECSSGGFGLEVAA